MTAESQQLIFFSLLEDGTSSERKNLSRILDRHLPLENYNHRIPSSWDFMFIDLSIVHSEINEIGRSNWHYWSFNSKYFTTHDFSFECIFFVDRNNIFWNLLIVRFAVLVFLVKINPKLEANEIFIETGWDSDMYDTLASCEPLTVTSFVKTFVTSKIFMITFTS